MLTIKHIKTQDDIDAAADLVRRLTDWAISLDPSTKDAPTFTNLEAELAGLPGVFGPPDGRFLLARENGTPVGCVAFCGHGEATVEVKRMYVDPSQRGKGVGLKLIERLIEEARALGNRRIVLDSYYKMTSAHKIYRGVGFRDVPAPEDFPEDLRDKVVFMEMDLG